MKALVKDIKIGTTVEVDMIRGICDYIHFEPFMQNLSNTTVDVNIDTERNDCYYLQPKEGAYRIILHKSWLVFSNEKTNQITQTKPRHCLNFRIL